MGVISYVEKKYCMKHWWFWDLMLKTVNKFQFLSKWRNRHDNKSKKKKKNILFPIPGIWAQLYIPSSCET